MSKAIHTETLQEKRKSADELIKEVLMKIPEDKKNEVLHLVQLAGIMFGSNDAAR